MVIINGENAILGRLSTYVAKKLMNNEVVHIVNADKIIITGDPNQIVKKYHERRARGSPQHGPFFPKSTTGIVRRTIRGMLPYKKAKGKKLSNLKIHEGIPKNLEKENMEKIEKDISSDYITVKELAMRIGGK